MATLTYEPQTTRPQRSTRQRNGERIENRSTIGKIAKGLGWFSIGLGVTELIAPKAIAKIVGTRNHKSLIRVYGVREIAAGVGILASRQVAPWLWARVAGDAVDLASLGAAAKSSRNGAGTVLSIASVAGVTMLDVISARCTSQADGHSMAARAESSIIVNRSPEECYNFWRRLENLPQIMTYLRSVRGTGDRRSHWIAEIGNRNIEWDAEIETDIPNQRISWHSVGGDLRNRGSVEFERATGGRGTIVRVQMDYGNTLHAFGAAAAKLAGHGPEQLIHKSLHRFKQVMETGEPITTEGQPAGRRSGATWLDQIAR